MDVYPLRFGPIYLEKIWGGRALERLFGRGLPAGKAVGESWELADLAGGVSVVSNGPAAGTPLTELTRSMGADLLGGAAPMPDGRFPLLLKLLDANDILSLQVHPDAEAVRRIRADGADAALKTECWYVLESRDGMIYKGVRPGVTPEQFRRAIESDAAERVVRPVQVAAGEFHYLPAGTVHALGAGVVVAEVQTPSDTTYRVTDWGRGRDIHVERSMQCIHFAATDDDAPGAEGDTLLGTDFFTVARRSAGPPMPRHLPDGRCVAVMMLQAAGHAAVHHTGKVELVTKLRAGDTVLVPAGCNSPRIAAAAPCTWLEITLPEGT
ncbi:MAG TPA: type I phosphomannose isomerase catalytic subunit [Phycisphaerae bacterium]|nr:type I phosphomannose isomerase catalytic subunit [Phycisphaerae bacterium]